MHTHLEIVMPPTDDVDVAVKQIMEPFNECPEGDDEERSSNAFWDFYVIGGRWAGAKLKAGLDSEKIDAFYKLLSDKKVTCSGLQCGKQELSPASQIPMVDELWREMFPESPIKTCPLFAHYNNQYENSEGYPDIMRLKDVPAKLVCSHVIIAGPDYKETGMDAKYMIQDTIWNGVIHAKTTWDETLAGAIAAHVEKLHHYKEDYAKKITPADDWLVVTVDYHS